MFTGIIESTGIVNSKSAKQKGFEMSIVPSKKEFLQEIKIGDSISVNGTCQTVTAVNHSSFIFYSAPATIELTTFSNFKKSTLVNLEKALKVGDRLNGHFVYGHVEAISQIISITPQSDAIIFTFSTPSLLKEFIISQGSIAIDGISLTLYKVEKDCFSVSVIPLTFQETNLHTLRTKDFVNLEADAFVKNISSLLFKKKSVNSSESLKKALEENGF